MNSPRLQVLLIHRKELIFVCGVVLAFAMVSVPVFSATGGSATIGDPAATAQSNFTTEASNSAQADPKPVSAEFFHQKYMFNWEAERATWAEHGFAFNAHYISDNLGDIRHPQDTTGEFNHWQRVRATIDLYFGRFSALKGLSYHATGVWQNGLNMGCIMSTSGIYGCSLANPSGITSSHQFRLDSMTLGQKLLNNKLVLTAGIMAAQDFYGIQEYGGSFVMEPMDYNFDNMGNVRASYDPESGPGAEIKVIPNKRFYVKTAWFMPSDDGERHTYPTGFNYKNGTFGSTSDTEFGFYTDPTVSGSRKSYPGIVKVGFIYNGGRNFYDYGSNKFVGGNYTLYLQGNQPVFRVEPGSNRGLDVTVGLNIGPQSKSEVPTAFDAGFIFNSPIPQRPKDGVAFALVYNKIGSDYNAARIAGRLPSGIPPTAGFSDEKAYEINYKAQVAPWLVVQPVFQYYANVGGRSRGSAGVAGFRLQTTF